MLLSTTKEDAQTNYLKNRGQPGEWFQHKADFRENQPVPRIRQGGFEIYEKSRATIGEIILPNKHLSKQELAAINNECIHVRLTTEEALRIQDKFTNQPDKWFDFAGNQTYQPPAQPKRLYTETAYEIADAIYQQRHHDWYAHNRPANEASAPPVNLETVGVQIGKCNSQEAIDISRKMRSSHAQDWFRTWTKKDTEEAINQNLRVSSANPRVKYEGMEYANRSRGEGPVLLAHNTSCAAQYNSDALPYRCNTTEAGDNCRSQVKGSSMARCLGRGANSNRSTARSSSAHCRVLSSEAKENLLKGRDGVQNMAVEGTAVAAMVKPKVRPEGEEFYLRNRGEVGGIIDQSLNKGYKSPQPKSRITTVEAQHAADINKGVMSSIVGETSYRNPRYPKKYVARSIQRGPAEEIARKSCGSSMKELVGNYRLAPEPYKQCRMTVSSDYNEFGEGIKRSESVGASLKNYGDKKVVPEVPPLRILGEEAAGIAEKYKSRDFFKTIQQKPPTR